MLADIITYLSTYQNLPTGTINNKTHLIKDLGMSSLEIYQLISVFENELNVVFNADDIPSDLTVEEITRSFERLKNENTQCCVYTINVN